MSTGDPKIEAVREAIRATIENAQGIRVPLSGSVPDQPVTVATYFLEKLEELGFDVIKRAS